jgi:hypothetical protein
MGLSFASSYVVSVWSRPAQVILSGCGHGIEQLPRVELRRLSGCLQPIPMKVPELALMIVVELHLNDPTAVVE